MNVTITGSIAYDYLMSFPGKFTDHLIEGQLQNISVSFLVNDLDKKNGGVAPNIAYTNALLGGSPKIMATAGKDFTDYKAWLDANNVDTSGIKIIEDKFTASFFANTDSEQNQIASFYSGAMANAGELTFAESAPETDITIVSPNDPVAMQQYMKEAKASDIKYIYDPSQQTIWLSGEELAAGIDGCYLLTVNEYELSMIKEKTGFSDQDIFDKAGGVLVTKGKDGSTLTIDGNTYEIPVFPPNDIVDPTGAGDAYRAGMLRGIQLGLPWDITCRIGALCSVYVLEQMGPSSHKFTIPEFIARFRQHQDDGGALDILLN